MFHTIPLPSWQKWLTYVVLRHGWVTTTGRVPHARLRVGDYYNQLPANTTPTCVGDLWPPCKTGTTHGKPQKRCNASFKGCALFRIYCFFYSSTHWSLRRAICLRKLYCEYGDLAAPPARLGQNAAVRLLAVWFTHARRALRTTPGSLRRQSDRMTSCFA